MWKVKPKRQEAAQCLFLRKVFFLTHSLNRNLSCTAVLHRREVSRTCLVLLLLHSREVINRSTQSAVSAISNCSRLRPNLQSWRGRCSQRQTCIMPAQMSALNSTAALCFALQCFTLLVSAPLCFALLFTTNFAFQWGASFSALKDLDLPRGTSLNTRIR